MIRNLPGFLLQRFSIKLAVTVLVFLLINNAGYAISKTSTGNGNWNSAVTWSPAGVPATGDDVTINHNITLNSGEVYTVNSTMINGSLTVNGTLVINGDLSTGVNGEFLMGSGAVVIVKGNVLLGNKCVIDLSSYFIVLGNFTKTGSDQQGSITANNAHIYILGTTTAPPYFVVCDQYSGTTTNTTSSCDGGTVDALITNETGNTNPIISNIIQQTISTIIPTIDLTPATASFCSGGFVTLTINESKTIELLEWYRGASLIATQSNPQSPYSYSVNVAETYYALYKVIENNTDVWYKTYSAVVSVSGSSPAQPGGITGLAIQCPASVNQIYSINSVASSTSYTWTVPPGWTITEGAGTTSIKVTTGNSGENGNISVTAVNNCGTSPLINLAVTISELPTATITANGPTTFCSGESVTLTSSIGSGYLWSTGATTQSINVTSSGNYTVQVTNANGCQATSMASSITVNTLPTASITYSGSPYCASGTASVTQTGQTGGTYSSTAGLSINSTSGAINLSASTQGTYSVTYNFSNGLCSNTTSTNITIFALPAPTFIVSPGSEDCAFDEVVYTTQSGMSNYVWNIPGILGSDYTITSGGTGSSDYTVTLKWITDSAKTVTVNYTDGNGCTGTPATSTVTIHPIPSIGSFN